MTTNQETIISHVLMQVKPDTIVDEATIKGYINVFKVLNPITAEEEDEVIRELHSKLSVRIPVGLFYKTFVATNC